MPGLPKGIKLSTNHSIGLGSSTKLRIAYCLMLNLDSVNSNLT